MSFEIKLGSGFLGLLTIVFVIAKLWGKIDWDWWWIFSPLWIGLIIGFIILIVILFIMFIWAMVGR